MLLLFAARQRMYSSHEIFARMSPATASQLLGYLQETEKPLYKASIENLTKQRKLRPVFVERKPREERHTWMKEALGRKANDAVAAHLLQIWLVSAHKAVLCDFLDALGIAHDENGTIEQLPPSPSREDLAKAIDTLLAKHPADVVLVYLHAFQALDETGWAALEELLKEDARLQLGAAA